MTAIGYAWMVGAFAFIVIAVMYWCFIEGSEWEDDDDTWPWNAVDAATHIISRSQGDK